MSSVSKNSKISLKTTSRTPRTRRITTSSAIQRRRRRRRTHAVRACCSKASSRRMCSKVSDKLQALKNLIPNSNNGDIVKADQLFQETANYILRLRTQVFVLQRLVQIYGSTTTTTTTNEAPDDNTNVVL